MYPTSLASAPRLDEHLPRLVDGSCGIRLVFYTTAHDRICLDTYPAINWLAQDDLLHSAGDHCALCYIPGPQLPMSETPLQSAASGLGQIC